MYENGQLKSGFDLLAGMAEKWGSLDSNTQKYIATTLAGTHQLNNFLALMNNFDHAIAANETALNSVGSAMRENEGAMDSLAAKTNLVRASFEELSNNLIDSELVKSILDLANGALELANTDIGTFVAQVALLSGLTFGLQQLTTATKVIKVVVNQFKAFADLISLIKMGGGLKSIADGVSLIGLAGSGVLPIIIAISGALVALYHLAPKISQYFSDMFPTVEQASDKIIDLNTQLEANKEKLDELNATPWYDRNSEIEEEIKRLEEENAELEKNLGLWRDKRGEAAEKEKTYVVKNKKGAIVGEGDTEFDAWSKAIQEFGAGIGDVTTEQLENLGYTIERTGKGIVELAQDKLPKLVAEMGRLSRDTNATEEDYKKFGIALNDVIKEMGPQVQAWKEQIEAGDALSGEIIEIIDLYDQLASNPLKAVNQALEVNEAEFNRLLQTYPKIQGELNKTTGLYEINQEAIINALLAGEDWALTTMEKEPQLTAVVRANVEERIRLHQLEAESLMLTVAANREAATPELIEEYNMHMSQQVKLMELLNKLKGIKVDAGSGGPIRSGAVDKTNKKIKTQIELLKEELEILNDRAWFLEQDLPDDPSESPEALEKYKTIQGQRVEIFKQAQEKIMALMKVYTDKGYSIDSAEIRELKKLWYEYEKDIKGVYKDIEDASKEAAERAEEAWRNALDAQIEALEEQKSVYESFFNFMVGKIDEQIEALEAQKEFEEKYWDDKIAALEKQNEEIERQIQLEQLQDALARAKQTNVMVYKDGKFQYIQDLDEISQAQADLESYEREEALRQEVANLEQLKNQAIASIDQQIQYWELYKKQWSSVVDNYQKEQERLLIEQQLGISLEGENWMTRLTNLEGYVKQYEALMARLSKAQGMANGSLSVRPGGGGNKWDILAGGNKSPWGSSSGGGGGGGRDPTDRFVEDVMSTGGGGEVHTNKYDPDIDYSQAWKDAYESGASQDVLDKIEDLRDDKIENEYGGKDPNPNWKHAKGTTYAPGGISLVGEKGPEMRVLNEGDGILPADITKNLWQWGATTPAQMMTTLKGMGHTAMEAINIMIDNFNPNLPNVSDGEGFVDYLKHNFWRELVQFQGAQ